MSIDKMKNIIFLKKCTSTNEYLSNMIEAESANNEYVVCSDFQTGGKGQGEAFWESEKEKNLTFSYNLINIDINAVNQFYISIIISLSIVNVLKELLPQKNIKIKWPNDVYIDDKKVAGILIENTIFQDKIVSCNIGIGINVNQKIFTSNAPNPVSIIEFYNAEISIKVLLDSYFIHFDKYYEIFKQQQYELLKSRYMNLLYRKGNKYFYKIDDEIIEGTIVGVDEFGFLLIDINGLRKAFDIKQVVYLY